MLRLFLVLAFTSCTLFAQFTTGTIDGIVRSSAGRPETGIAITAIGLLSGLRWSAKSDFRGEFRLVVPQGSYKLQVNLAAGSVPALDLHVSEAQSVHVLLTVKNDLSSGIWTIEPFAVLTNRPGVWSTFPSSSSAFAESYSLGGTLLAEEPAIVSEPLDFTGVQNTRIPLISQRAFSWTATTFSLEDVNATDPYQPGHPVVLPDIQALAEVTVASSAVADSTGGFGVNIGLHVQTPGRVWHGNLDSSGTGAPLASGNLPAPANRGMLRQTQHYDWFTRNHVDLGGPLGRHAYMYFSGAGQWASETVPVAPPGQNQNNRLLFGSFILRYQPAAKDQLEFLLSGSRIDLSDWGEPLGLESLIGWRMMPIYESPYGFSALTEVDHFDFVQAGWTRQLPDSFRSGVFQFRYGASIAHLDTKPSMASEEQSQTELSTGAVTGAAPLANVAVRQRESLRAVLQPGEIQLGREAHQLVLGAGWDRSNMQNRFTSPSDLDLITAAGLPAYAVELNTPLDSRARVQSFSIFGRDRIRLAPWLSADLGATGEFSRGSLPEQGSPAGAFTPARDFGAQPDLIAWNTVAPHAGLQFAVPGFDRLILGGTYTRFYSPLAGRLLDYANPNSLSGLVFRWNDRNRDGVFQPAELGPLLRRFGGAYSSISPSLHSPYADQFEVYAATSIEKQTSARVALFRRDDKDRILAADIGVPAQAYHPVQVLDPGPDGLVGTFDDRWMTVYNQNASTFGADRFLLENQPSLRTLYEGLTAEVSTRYKQLDFHVSFTAEKSFGPANPGNGPLENDAGIVGALYQDPNTSINATGHDFFDRAFLGKIQMVYRAPSKFGGIEILNAANYLDGLPFARELLVTGLAQGPIVVPATIRGSPEGGNRAEYVLNWNLRLNRSFPLPFGLVHLSADVLNVTNCGNRVRENDLTGLTFNQRLPVAIEAPRSIRLALGYTF